MSIAGIIGQYGSDEEVEGQGSEINPEKPVFSTPQGIYNHITPQNSLKHAYQYSSY